MSESPVVDQGSTRGAFEKIRHVLPDCSVVLTGSAGVRVCGPTERVSRWSIWARQYEHYAVVSSRRISVTRHETMSSRDPRFDLDLTIDMEVSINNAEEYVRLYGTSGSVVDPFYVALRADLRERVRNRVAAEINILGDELQKVSKKICEKGADHGPVTVHAIDMHARLSQRAMDIFQAMSIHDIAEEHGDAFLLALISQTTDESRKRAYNDYYNERRKRQREDELARRDTRDDFAAYVARVFADDPKTRNKLLTDPKLLENMKGAFERSERVLIANRPVQDSLVPPDTKPRPLLAPPDSAAK
jgi:hypothetical protein